MPDKIWYHDYQIVKVNPAIEIENDMIVDLGDIDEFKKFVKTVSFGRKAFELKLFQKSADCHFVTYSNQNRKLLSKKGKRIQIPSYASKPESEFPCWYLTLYFSGSSGNVRQSFVRSKIFYWRGCY